MKIKVKCAICGKEGQVIIKGKDIIRIDEEWYYFGKIKVVYGDEEKLIDYWECKNCYEGWFNNEWYKKRVE